MYRILLVLSAFLIAPAVFAQSYPIDKGSYLLGGIVGFTSQGGDLYETVGGDRGTTITINPTFGYFVTPGLALGGDVQFQKTSQGDFSTTTIGIGPSLAYYFGQPASKVYPFISGNVGYASLSADAGDFGSESINGYQFGVSGGLSYMIARNVALTGGVFFQNQTFTESGESASGDTFGFQGGVTAFIF